MLTGGWVGSEWRKLLTLPAIWGTCVGAVVGGGLFAVASRRTDFDPVVLVQAVIVLAGVLPVAHEYSGRQIQTSLLATPLRLRLLAGKTIATAVMLAVLVGLVVSAMVLLGAELRPVGAWSYLVLIGLFAYAVALVVKDLIGALSVNLVVLLVVSPLIATLTDSAGWLPGVAGRGLYQDGISIPGAAALVCWIVVIGAGGSLRFCRRDA